jgi:dolichol-phosphate mannosyltransferase
MLSTVPTFSFILPTYNERENIVALITRIQALLSERGYTGEVIVVDDNSPDGTSMAVDALTRKYPNVRLETRVNERGLGTAYVRGFELAKGDFIITMDVDGSHDVDDVPRLIKKLGEGYDVVVGSRYIPGGRSDKPRLNRLVSHLGGLYSWLLLGLDVIDSTNGFHAFRREVWERLRGRNYSERNTFTIEFLYYAKREGARMVEVPVFFHEREAGASKTNLLRESLNALALPFKLRLHL